MGAHIKVMFFVLGLLVFVSISEIHRVEATGECGSSTTPDIEARKLAPCATAARDPNASVSQGCCVVVQTFCRNPKCLCAILLSNTAKMSGFDLAIAITIPKRCNIANRPVGYKCGPYTLP